MIKLTICLLRTLGVSCLFFGVIAPALWIGYRKIVKHDKRSIIELYNEF